MNKKKKSTVLKNSSGHFQRKAPFVFTPSVYATRMRNELTMNGHVHAKFASFFNALSITNCLYASHRSVFVICRNLCTIGRPNVSCSLNMSIISSSLPVEQCAKLSLLFRSQSKSQTSSIFACSSKKKLCTSLTFASGLPLQRLSMHFDSSVKTPHIF